MLSFGNKVAIPSIENKYNSRNRIIKIAIEMAKKSGFQTFDKDTAKVVVKEIKEANWKAQYNYVVQAVQDRMREVFDQLPKIVPVVQPKLITMRRSSLQLIFETIKDKVGSPYVEIMKVAGEEVGASFGHDLIRTLKEHGRLPQKHEALLEIWCGFDSSADWGRFEIEGSVKVDHSFLVKIRENFLTRDYEKDPHMHCGFMVGYIKGVINETFIEWARWMKEHFPFIPPYVICESVHELEEKSTPDLCVFSVKFRQERLIKGRDMLVRAFQRFDEERYSDCVADARSTMEFALKRKIGFDVSDRLSFFRGIKAYDKIEVSLPSLDMALRRYDMASQVVHKSREARREESYQMILFVRRFIDELEAIPLTNAQVRQIRELSLPPKVERKKGAEPLNILAQKILVLQRTLEEFKVESKKDHMAIIEQTKEVKKTFLKFAKVYPDQVATAIRDEQQELIKILGDITEILKERDPEAAREADNWRSYLIQGIDLSANIIQLVTFLTGISSMPVLLGSQSAARTLELIRSAVNRLRDLV